MASPLEMYSKFGLANRICSAKWGKLVGKWPIAISSSGAYCKLIDRNLVKTGGEGWVIQIFVWRKSTILWNNSWPPNSNAYMLTTINAISPCMVNFTNKLTDEH